MDVNHLAEGGASPVSMPVGLTAEGRLTSPPETPGRQAGSTAATQDVEPGRVVPAAGGEPELASLMAFVSGREPALSTSLEDIEQRLVQLALERSGGNITAAAQMLGMSRAQVSYRLKGR
ncbi:Bacterial regulatory protein, Fis family [compost metagenome]